MGSLVTAAEALAARLRVAGVKATHDPAKAAAAVATVYVEPPTINYVGTQRGNRWRLVALCNQPGGNLAAITALDALVQATTAALPIQDATYATYQLLADRAPFPAYLMTYTD